MTGLLDTIRAMDINCALSDPALDELLATDTEEREDLPVTVVLYNDDVNSFNYVTFVLQKVLSCDRLRAEALMLAVHHEGHADVKVCPRSEAEALVLDLASYLLTAGIRS